MTANEIQNLADGIPITRLEGVLKETYKPKTGQSAKGDWQVQDAVLQLPDGEVRLKAWNCGDLKNLKGQQIVIEAHKSERHGWTGVQKEVEDYNGKTYHRVKLTESCKIAQTSGTVQAANAPTEVRKVFQNANSTTVEYDEDAAVREARAFAMKAANGLLIALDATLHVATEYEKKHLGEEIPPTQKQAMTSSIFIGMHKDGFVTKLPSHPLKPLVRESVLPTKETHPLDGEKKAFPADEIDW